jgi:TP901 family phage tail tape measure protein
MSEEVSHLIIKVSTDQVDRASKSLDGLSRASDRVTGLIKGLVTVAAALAVFRQASGAIAEFDHNMQGVLAVVKATTAEMEILSDRARQFGADTQIAGAEAALGMKYLGQAGFTTNQIIAAMPGMLDLAVAGELDLASAADITTAALAGFQLEASKSAHVADVLAVAAGESNTSVFQMGDAMKYVAPIAAGMGKSIEEVSAAIGVLSNAGLQGSMAGTGLRQVLSSLASPTKEAADTLAAYGVAMDEVNPEIHSLATVIDRLALAGISASDALIIAGDRGGNALVALTAMAPGFHKLEASMANVEGRAKEMATVMGDDLTGDMKKLKGATNELWLALGDAGLRDVLRGAAQDLRAFTLAMADMVKSGEAGAWLDLVTHKLSFLADGFYNASENIATVWAATMKYITGDGKEAADDITAAFRNMPENIRAGVQLIGATFANLWESVVASGRMAVENVVTLFNYMLDTAKNVAKEIRDQLTNPFAEGKFNYVEEQAKAYEKLQQAMTASRAKADMLNRAASEAWAEEVTNILNERDVNIASSDAKIERIKQLRAAYEALREARKKAEADAAAGAGTPGAPPPDDAPKHFNTQEFELLRKSLQLEEKTVKESYAMRLDLIRRNTEEGSALRLELEASLNDRLLVEMSDAEAATQDRLKAQFEARQTIIQSELDRRLISEQEFIAKSQENWRAYTEAITTTTTTGARVIATSQLETYSMVLGIAGDISDQLGGLVKENEGAAKAMFIASKAIAIAQAVVNTELAATAALTMGPIAGIPMSAVVRGLGYSSIAVMAATAISEYQGKFEHGGMISAGKFGLVGESGVPEMVKGPAVVTSARSTAALMNGAGKGSGDVTINIINQAGVQVETQERDGLDGKVIDLIIRRTEDKIASGIAQGGTKITQALERTYPLRRGVV